MYIYNGEPYLRIQNEYWSGFEIVLLTKHSVKTDTVRYVGVCEVDGAEHQLSLYASKAMMQLSAIGIDQDEILFNFFPSPLPMKETGFMGREIPPSVDTPAWEYQLTDRREHAANSWIYDTYSEGIRYSFYLPKAVTEALKPPLRLLTQIFEPAKTS